MGVYDVADSDRLSGMYGSGNSKGAVAGASGAEGESCDVSVAVKAVENKVVATVVMVYLIGEGDSPVYASVVKSVVGMGAYGTSADGMGSVYISDFFPRTRVVLRCLGWCCIDPFSSCKLCS